MDEEVIFHRLAERMSLVTWIRPGETKVNRFKTISRRVKLFSDVTASQQPACFQAEHADQVGQVTGMPYKSVLEANWIIYQNVSQDPNALGTVENNSILKGVMEALRPLPQDPGFLDNRNTLNGLVWHCYVQGRVFKDPGDIDGQGMLIVPIKVLVP